MSGGERRSLVELLARYELEPSLKDGYLEGRTDLDILSSYQRKHDRGYTFYEIDTINVSSEILKKYSFSLGNKQRIIALSRELEALSVLAQLYCLADKDQDHWFGGLSASRYLRWSKYCSVELHFFTEDLIEQILVVAARSKISEFKVYFESLSLVLSSIYVLRLAAQDLGMGLTWVSFDRYLTKDGSKIEFSTTNYMVALLNSNSLSKRLEEFSSSCSKFQLRIKGDCQNCIRGHDLTDILAWSVRTWGGLREFQSPNAIERLYVLLAPNVDTLKDEFPS